MKKLTLTLFLTLICGFGFAQNQQVIDSLKHQLALSKPDTNQVNILNDLGRLYRQIKPDSTLIFSEKSLDLARKLNFIIGEVNALTRMSGTLRIQGDIPKSLEFRLKALKIIEEKLPQMDKHNIWTGIGLIYLDINDYPKALAYFRKALAYRENSNYGNILLNIERTFARSNQLDSAWYYAQKVYVLRNKYPNTYVPLLMDMGIIQYQLGNKNLAFEYLQKSILEGLKGEGDHRDLSDAYGTISGFFKETNQLDSCIIYAKKGLLEGQTIGYQKGILVNANLLAELYESKDIKQALYYHKIAKAANDELYGVKRIQALQKNITDEQERQREMEAERIAKENQLRQYALLAGLGVFLLIAFLLYLNNRQKQKANAVLLAQKDEINEKSQELEKSLETLKSTQAQLIQSEKLASLGELTAGIAHEIQNPLNFVNNFSEVSAELVQEIKEERQKLKENQDESLVDEIFNDISQNLEKITLHGKRASSIVKGMLEHSRTSTGVKELTDINALADEYLRLAYHGFRAKDSLFNSDFELIADKNLPKIEAIPQDMGRVLLNLINNAFWAVNERSKKGEIGYVPKVTVSTQLTANSQLLIAIKDNGTGISEDVKAKIFQPFFTTKPTGQGTGLGLSLAYDIVTKGHGGTIEVESVESEGTRFTIKLPK